MSASSLCEIASPDGPSSSALWNVLGIREDAPAAERIRCALAQLEQADFLPAAAWHDAIELLTVAQPQLGCAWNERAALCREIEDRLRAEIDGFANRFFSVAPMPRRTEWDDLQLRARAWPSLRARLGLLEPGLALDSPATELGDDPRAAALAELIIRLFPLDAGARRRLIGRFLGTTFSEPHSWECAAHDLSHLDPATAALVPEFLNAVTGLCDHEREAARRREARAAKEARDAEWDNEDRWYDTDTAQGRRHYYYMVGIFGAAPLLLLIIILIVDLSTGGTPSHYKRVEERWPRSWEREQRPTRKGGSLSPSHSGKSPVE